MIVWKSHLFGCGQVMIASLIWETAFARPKRIHSHFFSASPKYCRVLGSTIGQQDKVMLKREDS
jgi:hypothetical protein